MSNNTENCVQTYIKYLAAQAQQIETPIEPKVLFFGDSNCDISGGMFPNGVSDASIKGGYNYISSDPYADRLKQVPRPFTTVTKDPTSTGMTDSEFAAALNKVNASIADKGMGFEGNKMPDSFYIPPNYRVYFYQSSSRTSLIMSFSDELVVTVSAGNYISSKGVNLTKAIYYIVQKIKDFNDMIISMCLGTHPDYALLGIPINEAWKGQQSNCDNLMESLCQNPNFTSDPKYKGVCDCFVQQHDLDEQYGPDLHVSVCCFGKDATGKTLSCYKNSIAYKTNVMSQGCCTFAECNSTVKQSPGLRSGTPIQGEIECSGNRIIFPTVPPPTPTPTTAVPTVTTTKKRGIPSWVWIVTAVAGFLVIVFIFSLAFVTPRITGSIQFPPDDDQPDYSQITPRTGTNIRNYGNVLQ